MDGRTIAVRPVLVVGGGAVLVGRLSRQDHEKAIAFEARPLQFERHEAISDSILISIR